jgi:endogenous inhibitor of DNA gyrase (YacG/DUF329 family)
MDDERLIAYCEECGNKITKDDEDIYVDEEGRYFCSIECALEFHKIHKLEM